MSKRRKSSDAAVLREISTAIVLHKLEGGSLAEVQFPRSSWSPSFQKFVIKAAVSGNHVIAEAAVLWIDTEGEVLPNTAVLRSSRHR